MHHWTRRIVRTSPLLVSSRVGGDKYASAHRPRDGLMLRQLVDYTTGSRALVRISREKSLLRYGKP